MILAIRALALVFAVYSSPSTFEAGAQQKGTPAANYEVDVKVSRIYVRVGTATRLGHEHGVHGYLKSGRLTLGRDGELVFDMTSFTADTADARKRVGLEKKKVSQNEAKKVTTTMLGTEVLGVAQYATATYRITSIAPLDHQAAGEPGTYQLQGLFTLHGTERKLLIKAKLERTDNPTVLKMTGSFTLRQTDYGIEPYSTAGGLAKVADKLEISGELILNPLTEK
jgi:polyisoprenoid-binding protein YceI